MTERIKLRIFDVVGGPIWVSTEDGQKVYDKIAAAFKAGRAVDLSFTQRDNLITAFINAAVGQLYGGGYSDEFLHEHLAFVEISEDDRAMLDRAIANAKRYFANRPAYDKAWGDILDEE